MFIIFFFVGDNIRLMRRSDLDYALSAHNHQFDETIQRSHATSASMTLLPSSSSTVAVGMMRIYAQFGNDTTDRGGEEKKKEANHTPKSQQQQQQQPPTSPFANTSINININCYAIKC